MKRFRINMAKQHEQILEEQFIAQLQALCYKMLESKYCNILNIIFITSRFVNKFANSKKQCTFVLTVPALHTVRSASGSFFLYSYGN